MAQHIIVERPGLVGFLPDHLVFNGLVVERLRLALVSVEVLARLFFCLFGNQEVIMGPPGDPAHLFPDCGLHRLQVSPHLGELGICWAKLRGKLLQLRLLARLLQAKVLNQSERTADGGGRTTAPARASGQPRNQLRIAALDHIVDRTLQDAVRLRLRFRLRCHLKLFEGRVIDLIPAFPVHIAHGKDPGLLLQLHYLRL